MTKRTYLSPEVNVQLILTEDVITTSQTNIITFDFEAGDPFGFDNQ